jgi:hypothetical protein
MPGTGFVVIETVFFLGGLDAVLDGPAVSFHGLKLFQGCGLGTPCREEGEIAVGEVAADQKTPRPVAGKSVVVFTNFAIGQFKLGPAVPARVLVPAPDKALPILPLGGLARS